MPHFPTQQGHKQQKKEKKTWCPARACGCVYVQEACLEKRQKQMPVGSQQGCRHWPHFHPNVNTRQSVWLQNKHATRAEGISAMTALWWIYATRNTQTRRDRPVGQRYDVWKRWLFVCQAGLQALRGALLPKLSRKMDMEAQSCEFSMSWVQLSTFAEVTSWCKASRVDNSV